MTPRLHSTNFLRNIGIIAHIDAGKTTLTERVLYFTHKTYKLGSVDEGTATTDWHQIERERGISVFAATVTVFWRDHQINIVDTPGHIDFTAEVQRSLHVMDGGVVIFDAVNGVEPQSETVWRQAGQMPRICFVNKMDRLCADFDNTVQMIRDRLKAAPLPVQLPIGREDTFEGVVDLLHMRAVRWPDPLGEQMECYDIPPELADASAAAHATLVERIAETDDTLTVKYLEGQPIAPDELQAALRRATLKGQLVPVLCGSSLRNKGVQLLLDAVVDYLPSPMDVPAIVGTNPYTHKEESRRADEHEPFAALVFKIVSDPYVGRLAYFRVYSGKVNAGASILNATSGKKERVGRVIRMYADHREDVDQVLAGDIGATLGLKSSFTGDTLCASSAPIVLEKITFPEPVISVAIEPKTSADQDKMGEALQKLAEEDPTFRVRTDENSGQTLISGMGELHLEVLVDRMMREFHVQAKVGRPRVAYRETILRPARAEGKYIRQTGGHGQYGHVVLELEPLAKGGGFEFVDEIQGGAIPKEFISDVEKGVREAMESGVLAGYPLIDLRARLVDGSWHEVDSSDLAFKVAGSIALKEGVEKAGPVLLEPVMKVEVVLPAEYAGDVLGNLTARRAVIEGMNPRPGGLQAIDAKAPLAEMFGYATNLRSMTQGRGTFTMEFDHYNQVPPNIAEAILGRGRW